MKLGRRTWWPLVVGGLLTLLHFLSLDNPSPTSPAYALPVSTATPWPSPTLETALTPAASPRKGVAPMLGDVAWAVADRHNLAQWSYYWGPYVPPVTPTAPDFVEYVPMAAQNIRSAPDMALITLAATRTPTHSYWLVFNECENNHSIQCNEQPAAVAAYFHDQLIPAVTAVDPDPQFIVGGVNAHPCGIRWLREFVEAYRALTGGEELPRAGWHFHLYPDIYPRGWQPGDTNCEAGGTVYRAPEGGNYMGWNWSPNEADGSSHAWRLAHWQDDMMNVLDFVQQYGRPDDEIWLTEAGCLSWETWQPAPPAAPVGCLAPGFMHDFLTDLTYWLNNDGRWVTRYAWWSDWDGDTTERTSIYHLTPTPSPTPTADPPQPTPTSTPGATSAPNRSALGNYYVQVTPQAAASLPWPRLWLPVVRKTP
ncbi:MAG: glycosyl hydrolase [Chloroflexota bacterium]